MTTKWRDVMTIRCRSCGGERTIAVLAPAASSQITAFTADHHDCPGYAFEVLIPLPRDPSA